MSKRRYKVISSFPFHSLHFDNPGIRYADVWNGHADADAPAAAAFLNATENSGAHAVHVAAYVRSLLFFVLRFVCGLRGLNWKNIIFLNRVVVLLVDLHSSHPQIACDLFIIDKRRL